MSDFVSSFWSIYVAVLTVASILACALLLKVMSTRRATPGAKPELHGHVWDEDLQEYNNPLPRWWMWLFYITIVFALVYLFLYPGLGSFAGYLRWSTAANHAEEMKAAAQALAPIYDKYRTQDVAAIAGDPAARAIGQRLFLNYCAQCHGSDAAGARGFPNLTDQDWLYGGDAQAIKTSIADGRNGIMPPFGQVLGAEGVSNVAHYVLTLSGFPPDNLKVANGRDLFMANCAACHGADAKGNPALGAPNLTDKIWLHGGTPERVAETISAGRQSHMPAHKTLLDEARINLLAAYVFSLSHEGQPAAEKPVAGKQ
jgi:cytochrome c oxidase cbb3-type subunit III